MIQMIKLSLTDYIKILSLAFLYFQTSIKLIHNLIRHNFLVLQSSISDLLFKIFIIINIFFLIVTWLLILNFIDFFNTTIATGWIFQLMLPVCTTHVALFVPADQFYFVLCLVELFVKNIHIFWRLFSHVICVYLNIYLLLIIILLIF